MSVNKDQEMPYANAPASGDPRKTEAWALTEAARRMKAAQDEPGNLQNFLDTLRLNWRLWTIFQAELSSPETPVPASIRQNMLSLCNYVDRVTVDLIAAGTSANVEKANPLININRQLARGLLGMASDDEEVGSSEDLNTDPIAEPNPSDSVDEKI